MRRDGVAAALCGVAGSLLVAACGGSDAATNANVGVCGGQTGTASVETPHYIVVLVTGPPEAAAGSAASSSPATASAAPSSAAASSASQTAAATSPPAGAGEVVLSGALTSVTGTGATHLELHICDRTTGAVVTNLHPVVTLRNTTTNSADVTMPVAVMEGSGKGVNDLHYGNNVKLQAGDAYTIAVRVAAGDTVTLQYAVAAARTPVASGTPVPNCMSDHQLC